MNKVEKEILSIFEKNGLVDLSKLNEKNYINAISDIALQVDSFLYISLLIEIEDKYDIEFDESTLVDNVFTDIHTFSIEIMNILEAKYDKNGSIGGKTDEKT